MSGLPQIIGQDRPLGILATLLRSDSLPHAILLTGIQRVGKATAAKAMAAACNCSDPPAIAPGRLPFCGRCRSCRRILAGVHPDVLTVAPAGTSIKIAQVRDLCASLAMKPYEAVVRVGIITKAHTMTTAAANALLKILEEPPAGTILVLTAHLGSDLLPTIVSRCRQIHFGPIPAGILEKALMDTMGLAPEQAAVVAHMAAGSYGQAMDMAGSDWLAYRHWLLETLDGLPESHWACPMALAETIARQKDRVETALALLQSYLRDMIVHRFAPGMIINRDLMPQIVARADKNTAPALLERFWAVEQVRRDIRANGNLRLSLEALMMKLIEAK